MPSYFFIFFIFNILIKKSSNSGSKLYGNDNFPGDILDLRVIGHISGGSGGIHKLEDKNGQVYTLKAPEFEEKSIKLDKKA